MKKYDYLVAIDPDCEKSGVATLRTSDKHIEVKNEAFPKLIDYFIFLKKISETQSVVVLVEASWLISHNWHANKLQSHRVAAEIGNKTGRNHQTGILIVQMAKYFGLEVNEVRPLKKCWNGTDGKISHDEIAYFIPDFPKRSNQEQRDAALLAWNFAGFSIKVKPITPKFKTANRMYDNK